MCSSNCQYCVIQHWQSHFSSGGVLLLDAYRGYTGYWETGSLHANFGKHCNTVHRHFWPTISFFQCFLECFSKILAISYSLPLEVTLQFTGPYMWMFIGFLSLLWQWIKYLWVLDCWLNNKHITLRSGNTWWALFYYYLAF